jgi:1-acyl-sn-glycerol-3-phosphate acyltransferase
MKQIITLLYTFWAWGNILFAVTCHAIIAPPLSLFFKDKAWGNIKIAKLFLNSGMFLCNIKSKVIGQEHIPQNNNFIIVCNHQSHIDIVILIASFPNKFAFIAKKELSKIPFLGWDLKLQGHVLVDRKNARSAVRLLDTLESHINNGKTLFFFPEGTRSIDGTIGKFKKGAFQLAVKTGTQILPCHIDGTFHILKKKSFLMKPHDITLTIGKPIKVEKQTDLQKQKEETTNLLNKTKSWFDSFPISQ